jgi:hypothetical protein
MAKKIGCVLAVRRKDHNNYGTSLQAYATVKVLQNLGYDVEIIRYNKNRGIFGTLMALPNYLKSGGKSELFIKLNKKINSFFLAGYKRNNHIRNKAVENFKESFFEPLCKYYSGINELNEASLNYDVCLVGSDQLWHPMGLTSGFYNLKFVKESIPKLAYAASFGVSSIPNFQIQATKEYLERFDWIGVREQKGKEIVESISNKKADFVCDPTMLLSKNEWEGFAKKSSQKILDPYIFCYFLGHSSDIRQYAEELSQKTNCKLVVMRHVDEYLKVDESIGDYAPYDVSPVDFVYLLSHAKYVLTDSFHGTIFSIIMEKSFLTFYRVKPTVVTSTHSRIDSLLNKFHLEHHLYKDDVYGQIIKEIDYISIRPLIDEFRHESMELLSDHL